MRSGVTSAHSLPRELTALCSNSAPGIIVRKEVAGQGTNVLRDCAAGAEKEVAVLELHMSIRPLISLSPAEVADLARNAADNNVQLHEANPYERGTVRWAWFNRAWSQRRRELQAAEA